MRDGNALYLIGIHVEAGDQDLVLLAVLDEHISLLDRLRGFIRSCTLVAGGIQRGYDKEVRAGHQVVDHEGRKAGV